LNTEDVELARKIKGQPQSLVSRPLWSETHQERYSEEAADITPDQKYYFWVKRQGPVQRKLRALARHLPAPIRKPLRALAKSITPKA
jgi:hypothetical protein